MDPITMSLIGGAGSQILGGAIGEMLAGADDAEREKLLKAAADEYGNIDPLKLERLVAEQLGPSRMEGVNEDAGLRGAEDAALNELLGIGQSGGLRLSDQAALNKVMNRTAHQASAGRDRIRESMAARGQMGSGNELAMLLEGEQSGNQRNAETGLEVAGMAQDRALQSLLQGGQLAGNMQQRGLGLKTDKARAADAIAAQNAAARGQTAQFNSGLGAKEWDSQFRVADARAGGKRDMAGLAGERANRKRGIASGISGAAAQGFNTYGQYQGGQQARQMDSAERALDRDAYGYKRGY